MPPVFGRFLPDPHPYDNALSSLSNLSSYDRALAFNIMYDHRVSAEREEAFNKHLSNRISPNHRDFVAALKEYHEKRIRTQRNPDYIEPSINANNLINGAPFSCFKIRKNQKLIRVLDLNGLGGVFEKARDEGLGGKTFDKFPRLRHDSAKDADEVMKWLNTYLDNRPKDKVQDFITQVLDVLNWFGSKEPYQPTWAALWSCFKGIENDPPERWLDVVGVHKNFYTIPRWLILLKYTVKDAGIIARPTQLDAGSYPYHFPSPPQAPLPVGGHSMDLCAVSKSTKLLPEVIHSQIPHKIDHWINAGSKCERVVPPKLANRIRKQRQKHHKLLVKIYGKSVYNWMNSPM